MHINDRLTERLSGCMISMHVARIVHNLLKDLCLISYCL